MSRILSTVRIASVAVGAITLVLSGMGHAMADTVDANTAVTFDSNPVTLSGDATADVTATSTTTAPAHDPDPPTTATLISDGKVTFQYATDDGTGDPVVVGFGGTIAWVALAPNNIHPDGAGQTSLPIDLDGLGLLPGDAVSIRAHYVTGGGQHKIGTHFSPAIDIMTNFDACDFSDAVEVAADLASGDGAPEPGDSGPWTFRIKVTNCTGVDLTNIKVQGGTNGWGSFVSTSPSNSVNPTIRHNRRNEILKWVIDLDDGEMASLLVTMDGDIPVGHACSDDPAVTPPETIEFLSGAWSAAYKLDGMKEKSAYSGRVSVVVTCPPV